MFLLIWRAGDCVFDKKISWAFRAFSLSLGIWIFWIGEFRKAIRYWSMRRQTVDIVKHYNKRLIKWFGTSFYLMLADWNLLLELRSVVIEDLKWKINISGRFYKSLRTGYLIEAVEFVNTSLLFLKHLPGKYEENLTDREGRKPVLSLKEVPF